MFPSIETISSALASPISSAKVPLRLSMFPSSITSPSSVSKDILPEPSSMIRPATCLPETFFIVTRPAIRSSNTGGCASFGTCKSIVTGVGSSSGTNAFGTSKSIVTGVGSSSGTNGSTVPIISLVIFLSSDSNPFI